MRAIRLEDTGIYYTFLILHLVEHNLLKNWILVANGKDFGESGSRCFENGASIEAFSCFGSRTNEH